MKIKLILTIGWISYCFAFAQAQTAQIHIKNGHMRINGTTKIVLNNAKWVNDGTFDAGSSTVIFTGNNATTLSSIEGNSPTTFYKLFLDKSNDIILGQDISIVKDIVFVNNSLILGDNDLSLEIAAAISNANEDRYIQTTGLGSVRQAIANGDTKTYPVGNGNYTPFIIQNNGTGDVFSVRVQNQLYASGTTGNAVTSEAINRSWVVEEDVPGGSNLHVAFQWYGANELTNFDRNSCFVTAFQSGSWQSSSSQIATGNNPYQITQAGLTQFDTLGIVSNSTILPVELIYFRGEKTDKGVLLTWETGSERDNKGFEVQVSRPSSIGLEWETLGFVNGNGTTQVSHLYEYLDNEPQTGVNYYRLKQIDFNEDFYHTKEIAIEYEDTGVPGFNVYPNPTTDYLTIEANAQTQVIRDIELYNITGQLVRQQVIDNKTSVLLDIQDLPNGTYIVRINQTVNTKIIKTN
mgnify:CR=1 FL=1